jgi:pilus assembly protein CpaD
MAQVRFLTLCVALASLSLGGCADWQRHMQSRLPEPTPAYADKAITVSPTRSVHVVDFMDGSSKISADQAAYLEAFIAQTAIEPGSVVMVEHPSSRLRLAHSRANTVETWLKSKGFEVSEVKTSTVDEGKVQLMVDHLIALGPNCPNWQYHPYETFSSQVSPNMGCSDRSNLAAMVANPRDLVSGDVATRPSGAGSIAGQARYNSDAIRPLQRESSTSVSGN